MDGIMWLLYLVLSGAAVGGALQLLRSTPRQGRSEA
jgi:hypothetical protein